MARLTLVTAPAQEPINVPEAAEWLRLDDLDTDEVLLASLIRTARIEAEEFINRAIISQTYDWVLDGWWYGSTIELPKPPTSAVSSIKYLDSDGVEQTWDSANYVVDMPSGDVPAPARVQLADGVSFPALDDRLAVVTIRFVAGWATPGEVPEGIRTALRMKVADLYEGRLSTTTGTINVNNQQTWKSLLSPYREIPV